MELLTSARKKARNFIPMIGAESKQDLDNEDRVTRIAILAYYKAEARGYEPGHEVQDWLDAEAEIDVGVEKGK